MGIYQSSGRTYSDPVGVVALIVGFAGALCSAALWLARFRPESPLLDSFGGQLVTNPMLVSQVAVLAAVLGAVALLLGIMTNVGGRAHMTSSIAIVLGVLAASYPVLTALNIITAPLRSNMP